MRYAALLVALAACGGREPTPEDSDGEAVDLTEALGPDEARAGVIRDPGVLPAGLAAEGRPGDVLLVNDRVRFVVQGMRDANYYVTEWGGVLDAEVFRSEGEPERDVVEKWLPMIGLGRILEPDAVEVISDGRDGGPAVVRVTGHDAPLSLIEGALESPGFVPLLDLAIQHTFSLHPGSTLLEVTTRVTPPEDAELAIADVMFGSPEASERYEQGGGFETSPDARRSWVGYVGTRFDAAAMTLSADGDGLTRGGLDLIEGLADIAVGGTDAVAVAGGETLEHTRWYGVGRTVSDLTDAWLAQTGGASTERAGVVSAPDGPVAGAWVHVLRDGQPWTLTTSDAEGRWAVQVPDGADVSERAVGERDGLFFDWPRAPHYAPYAAASVRERTLAAVEADVPSVRPAEGRGVADPSEPLQLSGAGRLTVSVADGLPFTVRVFPTTSLPTADRMLTPGRPGGLAAAGWSRGGPVTLDVPAGEHRVVVHRGIRFETHGETVAVEAGGEVSIEAELQEAYTPDGWWLADPHSHASPSGDGDVTMGERLLVSAGHGVQIHVGTDHDHVADYRPLRDALGLGEVLYSVVADEVSPPLRGHMNLYPLTSLPDEVNGGAWSWWRTIPETTEAILDALRDLHGPDAIVQFNHPLDNGVPGNAGWRPGAVRLPDYWTDRAQAVEVMNAGRTDGLAFWWDAAIRGMDITAVGVSDAHGALSGDLGWSSTFVQVDVDTIGAITDAAFGDAVREGRTVVTRGPFLELSEAPGFSALASGTSLRVVAKSPSWIGVDRIRLWRDGEIEETVAGAEATFILSPAADAVYAVEAVGDAPMSPVAGRTPWAFAGPYRVDVGGNGWEAPEPPLQIGDPD